MGITVRGREYNLGLSPQTRKSKGRIASQLCCLSSVRLQARSLTSLLLSFPICKMGVTIAHILFIGLSDNNVWYLVGVIIIVFFHCSPHHPTTDSWATLEYPRAPQGASPLKALVSLLKMSTALKLHQLGPPNPSPLLPPQFCVGE